MIATIFLGPVPTGPSTANTPGENIAWGIVAFLILCRLLVYYWRSYRRAQGLRRTVQKNGWNWLDDQLPRDFPLRELLNEFNRSIRVENAFSGGFGNIPFLACDCVIGEGKARVWLSLIASRADRNPFGAERFDPNLSVSTAQGWFAIQRAMRMIAPSRYRIFSIEEVIAQIESLG